MLKHCEREVISVGVDYLTATARGRKNRQQLQRVGTFELDQERISGNVVSEFRLFELQGLRCGSVEYATSHTFDMLRISSHVAAKRWLEVVQLADNVSRLDLQVTCRFTPEAPNLAEHVERRMKRFKAEKGTRLEIELRRNDVKGKTLYTGSRKSDLFSRLYDKGRESRLPELAGCWRLESQFQNDLALRQARALVKYGSALNEIYATVYHYYSSRGSGQIIPRPMSPALRLRTNSRLFRVTSSRRIEWLRSQVRPAIESEIERGNIKPVLEALGLLTLLGPTMDHTPDEE